MSHQIFLVSFGAFSILMFLLKKGSASKTVTLFFLVPPTSAMMAWQSAQVFANNKVRPMKHSIAANEGDATAFEAGIASKLSWLVRSVAWPVGACFFLFG